MTENRDLFGTSVNMVLVLSLVAQSCLILCDPMDCSLLGSSVQGDSPGKNTGVGCHTLLQEIFLTQGSKPGLLHRRWILYQLSHQGSWSILEWVAYPFSRGTSWPSNQTGASYIAGTFCISWATREASMIVRCHQIKNRHHIWWLLVVTPDHHQQGWWPMALVLRPFTLLNHLQPCFLISVKWGHSKK